MKCLFLGIIYNRQKLSENINGIQKQNANNDKDPLTLEHLEENNSSQK